MHSSDKERKADVLVVDDDEMTRMLAEQALVKNGFNVWLACDGVEALEMLDERIPDIILLDVEMPRLNGFDTAARIRERPDGESIPILMATGHQDTDSIDQAYSVGATDFATKPINWSLMQYRLRYMLRASRAQEKIRELAYFDSLTTLPNRVSFKDSLERSLSRARRHGGELAVLFLDLDDFKRVNDTLGHSAGDMLLKGVADRLRSTVRTSDTLGRQADSDRGGAVARLGGDEFTILVTDLQRAEDAGLVAKRILDKLSKPFDLNGTVTYTTPSIGISVFPRDGDDSEALLKHADTAMYYAKRAGKNVFKFHDDEMNEAVRKRAILDSNLRQAMSRGEFELHYQPQLALGDGRVVAVEALLRWSCGELGPVSPVDFIPLAEENGLIVSIGEWVLRTACVQAKRWRDEGINLTRMAVNISAAQFVRSDFVEMVARVLNDSGLEPEALELEITESLLAKDADGAVATLRALKKIGIQLSIDDFGTGYSSLSQLKRFPIDRLKIDRSFVNEIISDPDDAAITDAIIAMAKSMSLQVIAEGVETAEQMHFLKRTGCHEIQGYYISKPKSGEDLQSFLRDDESQIPHALVGSVDTRTLLMVDDDAASLAAMEKGLRSEQYNVLTANNAQQGFDHLANHDVDVVVSDFHMPGMNGNDFLERVRRLHPKATRIMLSGQSDVQSLIGSVNGAAIHKFLTKPVALRDLKQSVREAIHQQEQR